MTIAVSRELVWRCLTNSELLKQWYSQDPWRVTRAELDVRTGGQQVITIAGPDGKSQTIVEVFLEVVEGEKLVLTDAFSQAWIPALTASKVTEICLESVAKGTRLQVSVSCWNQLDSAPLHQHFEEGWRQAVDRISEVSRGLFL